MKPTVRQNLLHGGPLKDTECAGELEPLLDEREYARITKRSVASVRRDRVMGQGCAYVKLGALVRYRPKDVAAHIERNLRLLDAGGQHDLDPR